MTEPARPAVPEISPPTQHQLATMIWVAVFPTLTTLHLLLGDWLDRLPPVLRTFVTATIAVPIVIYGVMPRLHRLRVRVLRRRLRSPRAVGWPSGVTPTGTARPRERRVAFVEGRYGPFTRDSPVSARIRRRGRAA